MSEERQRRKPDRSHQGKLLRAAQDAKIEAAFKDRVFDIVREVHLPQGQVFQTQFGNKARHGYVLRDRASGEELVVGLTILRQIHDRYLGVSLPPGRRHWLASG